MKIGAKMEAVVNSRRRFGRMGVEVASEPYPADAGHCGF